MQVSKTCYISTRLLFTCLFLVVEIYLSRLFGESRYMGVNKSVQGKLEARSEIRISTRGVLEVVDRFVKKMFRH